MAVYDKRTQGDSIDQGVWSQCEITWQRYYVSCSWVAVVDWGDEREDLVRSPAFRWRQSGAPNSTPEAVSCLAALEEWLVSEGWEPVDEPREAWYALRFRRPLVPLTSRIAPYHSDDALTPFVDPLSGAEPTDVSAGPLELVTSKLDEYEAEIEAVEPAQANGTDPGSRRDDREAEERLAVERAEADRAEASRREAEWLEAVRREAERLEAARLEAARLEAQRLEAQRLEIERLLAERREAERLEIERLVAERRETERLEDERLEVERREAEQLEAEREAAYLELERLEAERLEAERREAGRLEAVRLVAERIESARLEAERERLEAERLEAERLEAERLAAQASPLRDLISSYSAGFDRNLDVRRIYGGTGTQFDPDRFTRRFRRRWR
jgi:hypothetical protein